MTTKKTAAKNSPLKIKLQEPSSWLGMPIPPAKPYLKFEELDEKQKEFYQFLVNYACGVTGVIPDKTGVGSLCTYLKELIEARGAVDGYQLELYDFLASQHLFED